MKFQCFPRVARNPGGVELRANARRDIGRDRNAAMAALGEDGKEAALLPSLAAEVGDVTGAGDAVSAAVLLGRLAGWDLHSAAWVASHCASIAISRTGTHHVTLGELQEALGGS